MALTGAAIALFVLLVLGEFVHVLPHYTNLLFPHVRMTQLHDEAETRHDAEGTAHAAHDAIFVSGEAVSFVVVLFLAAYLTTLIMDRVRQIDRELERTVQAALLEHRRLEGVVHAARVGMILLDADLTVRWFSQRVAEWLGWDASVIGRRCPLYDPPDGCADYVAEGYTKDELGRFILDGQRRIARMDSNGPPPPLYMPGWRDKIAEGELDDLIAYLMSLLPKEEGPAF
jgi:PAS domain-containing protein